jgi:hypothetical protein
MAELKLNVFYLVTQIQREFLAECIRQPSQIQEPAYFTAMYSEDPLPRLIRIDRISAELFRRRFKAYVVSGELIVSTF